MKELNKDVGGRRLIHVLVDSKDIRSLAYLAVYQDTTVSELVRKAIVEYLSMHPFPLDKEITCTST